jgi:hypothetical protein
MRKTLLITIFLIAAWIAWFIWPLTALYSLVRSVQARDATAIVAQLDPPAIRRSLMGSC